MIVCGAVQRIAIDGIMILSSVNGPLELNTKND